MSSVMEKPCPFCGQLEVEPCDAYLEDVLFENTEEKVKVEEGTPMYIRCGVCGACGPWTYCTDDDYEPIIEQWNRRV